jgi:hypothetical protein
VQGSNFTQAARLGPDGLVLGPNYAGVTAQRDDARDQTDVSLKNVKLTSDGVEFNAGSRTNSSINVSPLSAQHAKACLLSMQGVLRFAVTEKASCRIWAGLL